MIKKILNKIVDFLIEKRLKSQHIDVSFRFMTFKERSFARILNTLRRNKVMVNTLPDGIYIRLSGDEKLGEVCSEKLVKVLSFDLENDNEVLDESDNEVVSDKPNEYLKTTVLPKFNCSNCSHYVKTPREIFSSKSNGYYAFECSNFVHPMSDCVLRGFEGHSLQPGFSQTLNK
jgi:hypothetical protein